MKEKYSHPVLRDLLADVVPVVQSFWRNDTGGYIEKETETGEVEFYFWRNAKTGKKFEAKVIPDYKNNCIKIEAGDRVCTLDDPKKASNFLLRTGLNLSPLFYKPIKNKYTGI